MPAKLILIILAAVGALTAIAVLLVWIMLKCEIRARKAKNKKP